MRALNTSMPVPSVGHLQDAVVVDRIDAAAIDERRRRVAREPRLQPRHEVVGGLILLQRDVAAWRPARIATSGRFDSPCDPDPTYSSSSDATGHGVACVMPLRRHNSRPFHVVADRRAPARSSRSRCGCLFCQMNGVAQPDFIGAASVRLTFHSSAGARVERGRESLRRRCRATDRRGRCGRPETTPCRSRGRSAAAATFFFHNSLPSSE